MSLFHLQSQRGFVLRFALCMFALMAVYSSLEPLFGQIYLYPISLAAATMLDLVGVSTVLIPLSG